MQTPRIIAKLLLLLSLGITPPLASICDEIIGILAIEAPWLKSDPRLLNSFWAALLLLYATVVTLPFITTEPYVIFEIVTVFKAEEFTVFEIAERRLS